MTRSVDSVFITNWTDLGTTAPVPQWTVDIEINWTKDDGSTDQRLVTPTFPNILSGVPISRMRRYMEEIILRELRLQYGIDTE